MLFSIKYNFRTSRKTQIMVMLTKPYLFCIHADLIINDSLIRFKIKKYKSTYDVFLCSSSFLKKIKDLKYHVCTFYANKIVFNKFRFFLNFKNRNT